MVLKPDSSLIGTLESDDEDPQKAGRAFFLAIEGIDGAGKTTLARAVVDSLCASKSDAVYLPFPSQVGEIGQLCRRVLSGEAKIDMQALGHLLVADAIDYSQRIAEFLDDGITVIADRYPTISGWVYQSQYQAVDVILAYQQAGTLLRLPDITFILDLPEAAARKRRMARGEPDHVLSANASSDEYYTRLRQAYHAYYYMHAKSTLILNAVNTTADLVAAVLDIHQRLVDTNSDFGSTETVKLEHIDDEDAQGEADE